MPIRVAVGGTNFCATYCFFLFATPNTLTIVLRTHRPSNAIKASPTYTFTIIANPNSHGNIIRIPTTPEITLYTRKYSSPRNPRFTAIYTKKFCKPEQPPRTCFLIEKCYPPPTTTIQSDENGAQHPNTATIQSDRA